MTWWIDYETYSPTPIDAGVYRYTEDPGFRVLLLAWAHDNDPVQVETNHVDAAFKMIDILDSGETIVAHNANFERIVTSRILGYPTGQYLPPERWLDSMVLCHENGLPAALGHAAVVMGGEKKDEAGKRLINIFSKNNPRTGARVFPEEKPEQWEEFIFYCRQDVVTMRDLVKRIGANDRTFPPDERALWCADQRINDRGVHIDIPLARAAQHVGGALKQRDESQLKALTGVDNPNSVTQLLKWAQGRDSSIKNLRKETVTEILENPEADPVLKQAMNLRKDLALVAGKKFTRVLTSSSSDGRQRGNFRFYGAHTGRWTGSGVQLHNLPRAALSASDECVEQVVAAVCEQKDLTGWPRIVEDEADPMRLVPLDNHTLKALVRPMILGPLVVCDYSAIEARVIAWLAGEKWALDAFAAGRDIYVETADRMNRASHGHMTRKEGKVAVLALGYGGGVGSLRAFGYGGEPGPGYLTDEKVQELVTAWRTANSHIVQLWSRLERAFKYGGPAGAHLRVEKRKRGDVEDREIVLPSGRRLVYRNVRQGSHFSKPLGKMIEGTLFDEYAYNSTFRRETYGGRLVENVTQAVARDMLGYALVAMDEAGMSVVGHVHDEVLVEVPDPLESDFDADRRLTVDDMHALQVQEVHDLMCQVPPWAPGFPLAAAGYWTPRYKKD